VRRVFYCVDLAVHGNLVQQVATRVRQYDIDLDVWLRQVRLEGREHLVDALPRARRTRDGVRLGTHHAPERQRDGDIVLVHHDDLWEVTGFDFGDDGTHGHHQPRRIRMRAVHNVQDQVRLGDLLQRGAEGVPELVRQVADEADGVGQG